MAEIPNKPDTRKETYLAAIAGQNVDLPPYPITREEAYLDEIAKNGGGGGGTSDYPDLTNKPQINSVELSGNKTSADLGLQDAIQIDTMPTASATCVGKIVQFVGTTDANYTHGYIYECTTDGSTYAWTQLNVQPSSGGGTSDYTQLNNLPCVNGETLIGNKTAEDLGLAGVIPVNPSDTTNLNIWIETDE